MKLAILAALGLGNLSIASASTVNLLNVNTTVNNLNDETNNNYESEIRYVKTSDYVKYSTKPGQVINFSLPELLKALNTLNKIRVEEEAQIGFWGLPQWQIVDDNNQSVGYGYWNFMSLFNLDHILSSSKDKNIEFLEVSTSLISTVETNLSVYLTYSIDGTKQIMSLFELNKSNFPLAQKNMAIHFCFFYEKRK